MSGNMQVGSFTVVGLLLFGINQLLPSYILKNVVLEIFPRYIKCHSNNCEDTKASKSMCGFGPSTELLLYFHKI